ncbi:hypothetical protein [Lacticaseibacillus parakribbianus]|uniref:hypothetical protein n=1 Tax=Lacticaseibacillus parakribbianus TaxID=2970927 RepID=UPI0021CB1242|nr:hypothetical protein [Lacticaseibacillus parakribbianus]
MEKWVAGLANNLLLRELGVVALILLTIVVYYFRYVRLARKLHGRAQHNGLQRLIAGTRTVMVGLAFILLLVIGYDRVWPHFAPQAQTKTQVATTSAKKTEATSKAKTSTKVATAKTKADKTKKAASSTSASSAASSSSVTETAETQAATQLVSNYYANNPSGLDTTAQVTYRYLGDTTGNANLPVHRIGGFVTEGGKEVQKYEFWVYPGNQFDRQTDF